MYFTKLIILCNVGFMNKSVNEFTDLTNLHTYQAGVIQTQAHRKLKKEVTNFLKPYGLTMMEWFALGLINDAQESGARLTEISSKLQTTLPYTTNLVNGLMFKGYLTRGIDKNDSRAKILRLEPAIQNKCNEIEINIREKMKELIYSKIKPTELATYLKVLYLIANVKD